MPVVVKCDAPGEQADSRRIDQDHRNAGDRNGGDIASHPFGPPEHGHRGTGKYRCRHIVERGTSGDERNRVTIGREKAGPFPDDIGPQRHQESSDEPGIGTKQFGREELKENRTPDQLRRHRQQDGARRLEIPVAAIEDQEIEGNKGREQTYAEP